MASAPWAADPLVDATWSRDPILQERAGESSGPAIVLGGRAPVPEILRLPVPNAASAGRYPTGRYYSVGDTATFSTIESGSAPRESRWRVTGVDQTADRVEINEGAIVVDTLGNVARGTRTGFNLPRQFIPVELFVGRKWTAVFSSRDFRQSRDYSLQFRVAAREIVVVPAGKFEAFRVVGVGTVEGGRRGVDRDGDALSNYRIEHLLWLVPRLNFQVREEYRAWGPLPLQFLLREIRTELLSAVQQVATR